jgi:hypothetical protein
MNDSTIGNSRSAPPSEALIRSRPLGVSRNWFTVSTASAISRRAGWMRPRKCSPASVSETLRVVRLKSRTPSRRSMPAIEWLSDDGDTPSSPAAPRKLRRAATAASACSS